MPRVSRAAALAVAVLLLTCPACGDDDGGVGDERADQVRAAAREAGLPAAVADVLALAAAGPTATFQVTYAGTEGAQLVVSQDPPDRRVDVVSSGTIVESRVLRDGVAYRCEPDPEAPGSLTCDRAAGAIDAPGAFTPDALDRFAEQLGASRADLELTVERRTIADVEATCLITSPRTGTTVDLSGTGAETLCVSEEGAQLLVDAGGERLVAERYSTDVPEGTFDV